MAKSKIIVVVGPTASGKTTLATKIALRLCSGQAKKLHGIKGAEIISADSRQIYRGMDIGTAKPLRGSISNFQFLISKQIPKHKPQTRNYICKEVRHHLIDIKNPDENYTVAEYKRGALAVIRKILRKGKLPILVGGTGLYIKAVVDNLDIPAIAADKKLRRRLEATAKKHGLNYLFKKLVKLDPEAVYVIDPRNPRRVIRALEVAVKTGKPFSAQRKTGKPLFDALIIGINIPRQELKKRINARVDEMLKNGFVDETRNLVRKYGPKQKAFDAIGYREIIRYLRGEITLAATIDLIKKSTWRYAKRQMTWFKKNKNTNWLHDRKTAERLVGQFLKQNPRTHAGGSLSTTRH